MKLVRNERVIKDKSVVLLGYSKKTKFRRRRLVYSKLYRYIVIVKANGDSCDDSNV